MNAPLQGTGNADQLRILRLRADLHNRNAHPPIPPGTSLVTKVPPKVTAGWLGYFANTGLIGKGGVPVEGGGTLTMQAVDRAVYWREGIEPFEVRPDDDLNLIANLDEKIAEAFAADGFVLVPL